MGLLIGMAFRSRGISEVIMLERVDDHLQMAEEIGLTTMIAEDSQLAELKRSFDLAVDATGVPNVVEKLPDYIANG